MILKTILSGMLLLQDVPEAVSPAIQLLTEENHPFSFIDANDQTLKGSAVEIVQTLFRNTNTTYSMMVLPRKRAYRLALENPNVCIFALNKTPERMPFFEWVTPIITGGWAFYARPDTDIKIQSMNDLRKYSIVSTHDTASTKALAALGGFTLLEAPSDENALSMLMRGRADILLAGVIEMNTTPAKENIDTPKQVYLWKKAELAIGCGKGTNLDVIEKLNLENQNLTAFKETVMQKYAHQ